MFRFFLYQFFGLLLNRTEANSANMTEADIPPAVAVSAPVNIPIGP